VLRKGKKVQPINLRFRDTERGYKTWITPSSSFPKRRGIAHVFQSGNNCLFEESQNYVIEKEDGNLPVTEIYVNGDGEKKNQRLGCKRKRKTESEDQTF